MGVKTSAADEQAAVKSKEDNAFNTPNEKLRTLSGFTTSAKNPMKGNGITEPKRKSSLQ